MTSVGLGCKQRRLWFLLLMLMSMSLPQNCKEEIGKSAVSGFHRLYKLDYSRVTQVPNKHGEVCIKIAS